MTETPCAITWKRLFQLYLDFQEQFGICIGVSQDTLLSSNKDEILVA